MPGRLVGAALLALACLTIAAVTVETASAGPLALVEKREAPPLQAWIGFCERQPAECAVDAGEPETLALTPTLRLVVETINRYVNRVVRPKTDEDHWGLVDLWGMPGRDAYGDCEDFQLLKRRMLAAAGLPRRALRMTVVINEEGEGHAVLTLRTTRDGDLILDNRTDALLRWDATGYRFIKRESATKVGWMMIRPDGSGQKVATAAAEAR